MEVLLGLVIANSAFCLLDIKVRANVAVELRDNIEPLCSGASYPLFLAKLWPVFKTILKGDPVFTNLSFDQVRYSSHVRSWSAGSIMGLIRLG